MNIKLHIGAHKTATTHLQCLLHENRAKLSLNNIKLSIPIDNRKEWLSHFYMYCHDKKHTLLDVITSERPDQGDWILSEENISGVSYDLKLHPGIYPHLHKRLDCIKKIFYNDHIQIFFSIRSYETFYRSAYLEVVRNKGYLPFSEFYEYDRYKNNSWVSVIDTLVSLFSDKAINIWRYEDFRSLLPNILDKLTGLNNSNELISNYKITTTRPSISKKTLEILATCEPHLTLKESLDNINHLNKKYPANSTNGFYMPFSISEIELLQKKYSEDISIIQNKYPNINFLTP